MSEAEVQSQAVDLLRAAGAALIYHTHDSRRSEPGWPDIAAVVGHTLWCIECKTSTGIIKPEQAAWLNSLAAVPGVRTWMATPETLGALAEELGVDAPGAVPAERTQASTQTRSAPSAGTQQLMDTLGVPRERAEAIEAYNAGR